VDLHELPRHTATLAALHPYEVVGVNELGFLSYDSPFFDDFADGRIPLNVYHDGAVVMSVVNEPWL